MLIELTKCMKVAGQFKLIDLQIFKKILTFKEPYQFKITRLKSTAKSIIKLNKNTIKKEYKFKHFHYGAEKYITFTLDLFN